ncbi:OPT oligopeptide transporter [Auriculariales sp. MPI-PUGE-AT-0066]|nr:OPT oligopeptide transporter [Auriculariales sp. MPI-PUGE-AT-0066]
MSAHYEDKSQRPSNEQYALEEAAYYRSQQAPQGRESDYYGKEDFERGQSPTSQRSAPRLNHPDFEDPNYNPNDVEDEDDSPYPEVRSAVANTDDIDMPASTFRAWVIGIIASIILPGMNQFFFFRYPSVLVGGLVAQLLSYPLGRLLAFILPSVKIFGVNLNPGPFTIKEHVLITIMANIGAFTAYATDIVAVQRVFYNQTWSFGYQWMLVMSTQLIGFSFGGILRRFLVDPASMIWPANLVSCALFNTLHSTQYKGAGGRGMSREKFFLIAFAASAIWYFVPGYLFTALSYFSWVCWIAPNNVPVNQMFGYMSGMGMSLITFDWAQIAYIGSPLVSPWWAEANIGVGFVFFFWILTPILYYTNVWNAAYLPILSSDVFDNTGAYYDVYRILTPDMTFNETAYKEYSPLFMSTTFALSYGLSFAAITATIVHTILYYRRQIITQARRSLKDQPDIHARLMSRYTSVPHWWYTAIFLTMFVFGIVCIQAYPTNMPIWAFILALVVAIVYLLPVGMIQAITNQQVGLNVITELIVGYVLPGRPVAMMLFKTYGYITVAQALNFASDVKLGHYMKIPPRSLFMAQVVGTILAGTVQLGVQAWMFENINGICTTNEVFSCPTTQVFGAASIIWGVIGPQRQFSQGEMYYGLSFFFLIGALVPIIPWLMTRRSPNSWWKYVNFPVIFNGTGLVPWLLVGWFFQYFMRRRHFRWWTRYNFVLSAALDCGVAISAILIFFMLQFPKNGTIGANTVQTWWGNNVYLDNADGKYAPFRPLPEAGFFGPSTW